MSDLPLKCEIVESKVEVGPGKKDTNKIVLRVKNTSSADITFSGPGAKGELSIAISIGTGPENLVAPDESTSVKIDPPSSTWDPNPYKNVNGQATWGYKLPKPVLKANATAQLTLTEFESNTDPGRATITIGAKISGYNDYKTAPALEVEKKAEQFDLLYFTADPPYIITDDDREKFTLKWNAVKAKRAVLFGNSVELEKFKEGSGGFQSEKPFTFAKEKPSFTTIYKLVATDKADEENTKEKKLTVQVLTPRWYSIAFPYGYPAVLCSMDGVKLYGIFIDKGKAGLYSSEYPYARWTLENDNVPPGMETSPAVCFGNRLWLVGGSTANPNLRNKEIWCYKSVPGEWKKQERVPWTARMGHACVVFNGKLWVLGGNDETGTSVNDIWGATLNEEQLEWREKPYTATWQSRCMFAATVFHKKIWIYGGATEPFSDPLEDMWTSENGEIWERYEKIPKDKNNPVGEPIGATLQVVKEELNLIGSFRSGSIVKPKKFVLGEAQESWQGTELQDPWDGQENNTFSLLSVPHKGLIFLRSLNYRTHHNPTKLYMYVP